MKADIEAIKAKCIIDGQECWLWTGGSSAGYAQFSVPEVCKSTRGHRITYIMVKGEIPEGLVLDHLCRNTRCVNPDHLEAVTPRENALRGISPLAELARRKYCHRGHEYTSDNLHPYKTWRICRKCRQSNQMEFTLDLQKQRFYNNQRLNISLHRGRWEVRVSKNYVLTRLGTFKTYEEAKVVRVKYQETIFRQREAAIAELRQPDPSYHAQSEMRNVLEGK